MKWCIYLIFTYVCEIHGKYLPFVARNCTRVTEWQKNMYVICAPMRYPYARIFRCRNSDPPGMTCAALSRTGLVWSFCENEWYALSLKARYKVASTFLLSLLYIFWRNYFIRNFILASSDLANKQKIKSYNVCKNLLLFIYIYIIIFEIIYTFNVLIFLL